MYGKGISKEGSLIDVGVDLEIIKKSGAWFTYENEQLGQGRENARAFLAEHIDVRDEIERKIREAVGISQFGAEGDETIEIVPDVVLDDEQRAEPCAGQAEGQGRRRGIARCPLASSATAPGSSAEEPEELPRAGSRAPGGAAARPPRARAAAPGGGLRALRTSTTCSARLERVGLIDDEAFARQLAEHQFGSRRAGRRAVASALLAKGVAPELAARVADEAPDDEYERAVGLARSRADRLAGVDPVKAFGRLTSLLVRRGYPPDIARSAARVALEVDDAGLGRWDLVSWSAPP